MECTIQDPEGFEEKFQALKKECYLNDCKPLFSNCGNLTGWAVLQQNGGPEGLGIAMQPQDDRRYAAKDFKLIPDGTFAQVPFQRINWHTLEQEILIASFHLDTDESLTLALQVPGIEDKDVHMVFDEKYFSVYIPFKAGWKAPSPPFGQINVTPTAHELEAFEKAGIVLEGPDTFKEYFLQMRMGDNLKTASPMPYGHILQMVYCA